MSGPIGGMWSSVSLYGYDEVSSGPAANLHTAPASPLSIYGSTSNPGQFQSLCLCRTPLPRSGVSRVRRNLWPLANCALFAAWFIR